MRSFSFFKIVITSGWGGVNSHLSLAYHRFSCLLLNFICCIHTSKHAMITTYDITLVLYVPLLLGTYPVSEMHFLGYRPIYSYIYIFKALIMRSVPRLTAKDYTFNPTIYIPHIGQR